MDLKTILVGLALTIAGIFIVPIIWWAGCLIAVVGFVLLILGFLVEDSSTSSRR